MLHHGIRIQPSEGGEVTLRSWASYRPVAVINAADLEGEALSAIIEARKAAEGMEPKPEPQRLEAAEAVLGAWPVPDSFGGIGPAICPLSIGSSFQLPDPASFHSPAAFCATWAHEQIHSTGQESRLKAIWAVLLGDRLEIGSEIESHAAYLSHWIELLKESQEWWSLCVDWKVTITPPPERTSGRSWR